VVIRRRDLLRAGAVLGAAALTGCTTRHGGTPVAATTVGPGETVPGGGAEQETVRLGVFEYRPYAYLDDSGTLTGEVVEVARAICDELGKALAVEVLPYEAILPAVEAHRIDVVGGLSIRAANCASLDFTVPDHVSLTALVVPKGNPKGISTFADVVSKKARFGVVADSLEVSFAEQAGVRGIQQYPTAEELLAAVTAAKIDCGAYDDITLRDTLTGEPGLELRPSFEPEGGSPRYGFGFRKAVDAELLAGFDAALTRMHDNGEWLRVAEPFGFTEDNIPDTDRVSDEACQR
jgi:polar amino acid transport system substrate-binding protein